MEKSFEGLYIGSRVSYSFYRLPDILLSVPKYIASISPFVMKSNGIWNFKLGLQAVFDKNISPQPDFHLYPDFDFGFSLVPSYVSFFAELTGKLEKNDPLKIISENPFLVPDGSLFTLPNTSHAIIISSGLKGNNGIGGNYLVSASYSLINKMLFYSNIVSPLYPNILFPGVPVREVGNHFVPLPDNVDLLNIHGEISSVITDKISFSGSTNFYKYTLTQNAFAWNKPSWDGRISFKYNLRDKIIAGVELTGTGKRKQQVVHLDMISDQAMIPQVFNMPVHFNLNLNAEYRYSRILSFWTRFDNIANNRYFEWAYYPSQGFLFMLGFTYSL
jgi:hypothetical protein